MRDDRDAAADALAEGELLAAYLDGDTDDVTTARLERRLAVDATLAARLDAIAATRARMQRLAQVSVPDRARQRLHDELERERRAELTSRRADRSTSAAPRRARRWRLPTGPAIAAAAIALVTVLGLTSLLGPLGGGGGETQESAADAAAEGTAAEDAAAEPADTGDRAGAAGLGASDEAPEAEAGADAAPSAAFQVTDDAEIAARALRLRADPPADLRTRERRLREDAGLPTAPLCVGDLDAETVDLIAEGGRVALAVLLADTDEIVLLAPRTCTRIRTISSTP